MRQFYLQNLDDKLFDEIFLWSRMILQESSNLNFILLTENQLKTIWTDVYRVSQKNACLGEARHLTNRRFFGKNNFRNGVGKSFGANVEVLFLIIQGF